jgi:heme exporter protein D
MGMYWNSWSEMLAMGGYGLFVWGSFGMCAAVIVWELLSLRLRRLAVRRAATDEAELQAMEQGQQRI